MSFTVSNVSKFLAAYLGWCGLVFLGGAAPVRSIPRLVQPSDLASPNLFARSIPLPSADLHFTQARSAVFNPEVVLVKFRAHPLVSALRVAPSTEFAALETLRHRPDVEFAALDTIERRQFSADDPLIGNQWHHSLIGSPHAWDYSLGTSTVKIAIVDTPFQMDHPDLAANTVAGWDVVADQPVTSAAGISHSTICAGMAAGVINNGEGIAGAANCQILPINIDGAISEMYNAVIWAANHGVRIVNISWSGGTNDVLQSAGAYLRTQAAGILVMSAIDGDGSQPGPNQPDIYCISMTDAADNFNGTLHGPYIDFAAPGYEIYSTTIAGGYAYGTGCSFAAPLVAGIIGWMFSVNPTLQPADVISILQTTAADLGPPGWDEYYGWGRIDFAAAADAVIATLPNILSVTETNRQLSITANYRPGLAYTLCRTGNLTNASWSEVAGAPQSTNRSQIVFVDAAPPSSNAWYRVRAGLP